MSHASPPDLSSVRQNPLKSGALHPAERIRGFFAAIAPRYDLANHLLSGGLDWVWRRRAVALVAGWRPARILDLATGSGDLAKLLRKRCPASLVVGADFCFPMLLQAKNKTPVDFIAADALRLPFADSTFDAITIAFGLRNMASWSAALAEIGRVLRPGGRLLILEFSWPSAPLRWVYRPYLRHVLPVIAALCTGNRRAYEYLADSIEDFPRGAALDALFTSAELRPLSHQPQHGGIVTLHIAERESHAG
jgi:demethylmenaquinone methyltransferase/2-methoxy-6-polyprenyl-1,4-benzoquinol methylase